MEQRTVTFRCVYSYTSSLNPAWQCSRQCRTMCLPGDIRKSSTPRAPRCLRWTRTPRHSSTTQLKFKAHCSEVRQRHLAPALQGTCFALPCLSVSLVLLHLDFLYGDWHVTLFESTYLQAVPSCVFYVTNNQNQKEKNEALEWIISTELFVLLQIQGSYWSGDVKTLPYRRAL